MATFTSRPHWISSLVDPHLAPRMNYICPGCQCARFPTEWRMKAFPEEEYTRTSVWKGLYKVAVYNRWDPFLPGTRSFVVTMRSCLACVRDEKLSLLLYDLKERVNDEEDRDPKVRVGRHEYGASSSVHQGQVETVHGGRIPEEGR